MEEEKREKTTRIEKYKLNIKEEEKKPDKIKIEEEEQEEIKEHPLLKKILLITIISFIILCIYSTMVEPHLLKIKEYKIESDIISESYNGLKIVQFGDLYYGNTINKKQLDKIVNKINYLKPDIIFFTGDLIDKNINISSETKELIIESLNKLSPTLYKYAIYGDQDIENEVFQEVMERSEFILLNNEAKLLYYKDITPIEIIGFKPSKENPNYTILTDMIDEIDTSNLYKIVLIHEPDAIDDIKLYNPNLVLSGHTLGGSINIIKPLFLNEGGKKYYKDYYNIENTELFITNGLGTTGLNSRLNNIPSINFYRLYKKELIQTN